MPETTVGDCQRCRGTGAVVLRDHGERVATWCATCDGTGKSDVEWSPELLASIHQEEDCDA